MKNLTGFKNQLGLLILEKLNFNFYLNSNLTISFQQILLLWGTNKGTFKIAGF